jgi:hypothetical protein
LTYGKRDVTVISKETLRDSTSVSMSCSLTLPFPSTRFVDGEEGGVGETERWIRKEDGDEVPSSYGGTGLSVMLMSSRARLRAEAEVMAEVKLSSSVEMSIVVSTLVGGGVELGSEDDGE